MLDTKDDSMTLEQKILTVLKTNYVMPSVDQNIKSKRYVDEPRLDMIQWVTNAFCKNILTSLETVILWHLAARDTEEELRNLPMSAISHLVDVRFIRDADGGIGYEIRPKLYTVKI
jgi:hypothetical protein|nr:MAG TPA: hypothetical protein [Caudoviricetes sp.]